MFFKVYDEPSAQRHVLKRRKVSPDKQRPDFVDWRIIVTRCGLTLALTGHPNNKPKKLINCEICYGA